MKLLPWTDNILFWRAYNRLRDGYISQLQREIDGLNDQVATLWEAIEWRGRVNEELTARLHQALQTARDLEETLSLTGFGVDDRQPLVWGGALERVTVTRFCSPSTEPSEWRSGSMRLTAGKE